MRAAIGSLCSPAFRRFNSTLKGLFLFLVFAAVGSGPCLANEFIIYLDPRGSDVSNGFTIETAVGSLQQALTIAESKSETGVSRLRVAVASGEYKGQSARGRGHVAHVEIAIVAADPYGPRPRFDGDSQGGTWLDVRSAMGGRTSYKISGLEITNYETAINFAGDRDHTERSNRGNEIRNNIFVNIGQVARASARPSTAVVRLVNSDENVITGNRFVHVKNRERCALLHAIYVAHDSSGNVIEDNVVEDACGDAVRFRDGSHSNLVRRNTFIDAWGKAPVSDWYCDRARRRDCTKAGTECPSMNNVLDNNTIIARTLPPVPLFLALGDDSPGACPADPDGKRFITR